MTTPTNHSLRSRSAGDPRGVSPGHGRTDSLAGAPATGLADRMSDMWLDPAEDPRTYGNPVGEKATYLEYLANYRLTLELKCAGSTPSSSPGGRAAVDDVAARAWSGTWRGVEHHWFHRVAAGPPGRAPAVRRADDRDVDFNGAVADPAVVDEAFAAWRREIAAADAWLDALPEEDLGRELAMADGDTVSIRDLVVHMIEEYARHCGHADLLRECIDGRDRPVSRPP